MSLIGIASKTGVTSDTLLQLIGGKVTPGISAGVQTTSNSLQEFVNGGTSIGLAAHIGCTSATLQELRNEIGPQGAIGLIIGLCICARREREK
jgi:hypothetical protein